MQIPIDRWYEAIFIRRSRRLFNGRALADGAVTHLLDFSKRLSDYVDGAKAVLLVTGNPDKIFKGAVGSYGKIKDAPAYVAFVGNMENPNVQEKVGYLGECFILEATSLGLATCWVGGFFRPDLVEKQILLNTNEQVLAVSPLGYVDEGYSFEEKIMSGFGTNHQRKKLETLCLTRGNEWPNWIKSALEAARLAPSAVNRQPWRFSIEGDAIKISVDNPKDSYRISKRLDCGIAMLHLELGASNKGVKGQWEYLEKPEVALFKAV